MNSWMNEWIDKLIDPWPAYSTCVFPTGRGPAGGLLQSTADIRLLVYL